MLSNELNDAVDLPTHRGFLSDVDAMFRRAAELVPMQEGLAEKIRICNETYSSAPTFRGCGQSGRIAVPEAGGIGLCPRLTLRLSRSR